MNLSSALIRAFAAMLAAAALAAAQPAPAGGRGRGPTVVSPEVTPDGHVTFRLLAPKAEKVTLNAADISVLFSGGGAGAVTGTNIAAQMPSVPLPQGWPEFTKNDSGIWEATVGPLPPGAYRYVFQVDGVRVLDPVNTRTAESFTNRLEHVHRGGRPDVGYCRRAARQRRRSLLPFVGAEYHAPHARLHAARIRSRQCEVSRVLSAARRGR